MLNWVVHTSAGYKYKFASFVHFLGKWGSVGRIASRSLQNHSAARSLIPRTQNRRDHSRYQPEILATKPPRRVVPEINRGREAVPPFLSHWLLLPPRSFRMGEMEPTVIELTSLRLSALPLHFRRCFVARSFGVARASNVGGALISRTLNK